ncbi:MAG: HAD-IC family P-type ATPase, partial [Ectothiorhodospiraceae bacterium]
MTEEQPEQRFHAQTAEAALSAVQASTGGLSGEEVQRRLQVHGPNRLPEPPRRSPALRLLSHFHNVLIYVLLASAVVTAALGHAVDTGVILAVVLVNAVIGFVQEGRAEKAMEAIRGMLAPRSSVLRDGRRQSVDAADLVPGDIVLVEAGDRVPADLRLTDARGLKVQEAILTGESVPVDKGTAPVEPGAVLGDRTSMLFSGTLVAAGTGRGVVVATGADTQIGRISGMLATVESLTTPLVHQMDVFARWLTVFILLIAASLLVFGYFVGHLPFSELFMAVVGLSVAAIPEGLPAVLTITLAVGVQAMARRNAIVRRLPAIETLGSVSVICSDKTGTLTRNEMMAATLAAAGHTYSVGGEGYAPEGAVRWRDADADPGEHAVLMEFARAAGLCNDAVLHGAPEGWRVEGDPMEGALIALAGKITRDGSDPFPTWTRTDAIPFDAAHRYMAVLHHDHEGNARIHVKGAPEAVLAMCADQHAPQGGTEPLDADYWHGMVERLAADGQRVIA